MALEEGKMERGRSFLSLRSEDWRSWRGEEKIFVFVLEMNREEKKNAVFLLNCANQKNFLQWWKCSLLVPLSKTAMVCGRLHLNFN